MSVFMIAMHLFIAYFLVPFVDYHPVLPAACLSQHTNISMQRVQQCTYWPTPRGLLHILLRLRQAGLVRPAHVWVCSRLGAHTHDLCMICSALCTGL